MEEKKIDKETLAKLTVLPVPLSAEENLELLKKYREAGDLKLRNQIICGNLRFAVNFSCKYFPNLVNRFYSNRFDDLIQDLSLCLLYAAEKFDFSKNVAFSTYAGVVIRSKLIRKNNIAKRLKNKAEIVSFSSPASVSKDGKELTYEETLMDEKFTEDNFTTRADLNHILRNIVPLLSEREKIIFNGSFIEQKTQAQIAKILNVSQARVSRLLVQVRNKIMDAYENGTEVLQPEKAPTSLEEALGMQKADKQPILREFLQGELSLKRLAQKYNITTAKVVTIVKRFKAFCEENNIGFPKRKRVSSRHDEKAERNKCIWKEYLETDLILEEIAQKYSVSLSTVVQTIAKFKENCAQRGEEIPGRRGKVKSGKLMKNAEDTSTLQGVSLKTGAAKKSRKEEASIQTSLNKDRT